MQEKDRWFTTWPCTDIAMSRAEIYPELQIGFNESLEN